MKDMLAVAVADGGGEERGCAEAETDEIDLSPRGAEEEVEVVVGHY